MSVEPQLGLAPSRAERDLGDLVNAVVPIGRHLEVTLVPHEDPLSIHGAGRKPAASPLAPYSSRVVLADDVTVDQEQARALSEVNRIRTIAGLAPVTRDPGLDMAAHMHSRYQGETGETGHYETQSTSPYYVGYRPKDRALNYGYTAAVGEDVFRSSFGSTGTRTYLPADNSIQWWMAAIYHRFPIIAPTTQHIGYGPYYKGTRAISTLDFGKNYGLTGPVVKWPVPDQTGVIVGFQGESPNPVAQFGATCPCGYPVSVSWPQGTPSYTSISMKRASDGTDVPGYILTPQNDQSHSRARSLSFIPQAPLEYGAAYAVSFEGQVTSSTGTATPFSYAWRFTTQPAPGALVSSIPASGASGVAIEPSVVLDFSQPIRSYTLVPTPSGQLSYTGVGMSLIRVSDGAEVGINITQPTTAPTKRVQLSPSVQLDAGTSYRLKYVLADEWGRSQSGSLSFTTAATTTQPPAVTAPVPSLPLIGLGTSRVPVRLAWSGTDADGIASYQLQRSENGAAFGDVALPSTTSTAINLGLAPGSTYQFRVRATDRLGSVSDWATGTSFVVTADQESSTALAYSGAWSTGTSTSYYGGALKYQGTAGSRVAITFKGRSVSWVSTRNSNRGKAEVWLDGVKVATIDLYASTFLPRRTVFARNGLSTSVPHTLEVRVLGTRNDSSTGTRVDADAFVVLR